MNFLLQHSLELASAFGVTLALFACAAVLSLAGGVALGIMRIVPVPSLNRLAGLYVNVCRNVPPILLFFFVIFGLPQLGIRHSFFLYAVIALSAYEASVICEVFRAGVRFVAVGQAEAARAIGMSAVQVLAQIIVPQAIANSLPALGNCFLGLLRSTALAGAFGVAEATDLLKTLSSDNPGWLLEVFLVIAAGYIVLSAAISWSIGALELRWAAKT